MDVVRFVLLVVRRCVYQERTALDDAVPAQL